MMKTFPLSSVRVIAALALIVLMLAILISARGAPMTGVLDSMHGTHGYAPTAAVSDSTLNG